MRVATRLLLVALLVPNATLAAQQLFREPLEPWSLPVHTLTDPWERFGVQARYAAIVTTVTTEAVDTNTTLLDGCGVLTCRRARQDSNLRPTA
jgi:hypothetical protein